MKDEAYFIDKIKPLILASNYDGIKQVFHEYMEGGGLPDLFATNLMRKSLDVLEKQYDHYLISLTDIYRIGRVIESIFAEVMKTSYTEGVWHMRSVPRKTKIMMVTFNDWHEFGRILLGMFLRINMYDVVDVEMISTVSGLVEKTKEVKPDIIAISVLMTNSALRLAPLRQMLNEAGLANVKIVVGGAPFNFNKKLVERFHFDGTAEYSFEIYGLMDRLAGKE